MGIVVRLLLLCHLRRCFCHLLVVVVVAAVVTIFVIVIVIVANVVIVVVVIVVLRVVLVEHAVEGRVAGVVELDGVRGFSRVLPTSKGGHRECATASVNWLGVAFMLS